MSVFTRIFLSFWLALALSILASFVVFSPQPPIQNLWNAVSANGFAPAARSAADALERGDNLAARDIVAHVQGNNGTTFILMDRNGDPIVVGEPPPPRQFAFRPDNEAFFVGDGNIGGVTAFRSSSGKEYKFGAIFKDSMRDAPRRGDLQPLLTLLFVSGIICYGLAKYLTTPLVVLRNTAQRLADGDLSARALSARSQGNDEVSSLVRDFNDMADRIQKLVDAERRLTADVSHELRSPLARLNVALAIARTKTGPEAEPALDRIELETERLNELVAGILRLSALESSAEGFPRNPVDLSSLLERIACDAQFEAQLRGCDVQLSSMPLELTLDGDAELLHRAIENVVRNAIHYSAPGTTVVISVANSDSEIEIQVRDHGPGVPSHDIPNLFKPFYRVGTDRDRATGGHGLGLAISARSIELHNGTIAVRNAEGEGGLIVTVALPHSSHHEKSAVLNGAGKSQGSNFS